MKTKNISEGEACKKGSLERTYILIDELAVLLDKFIAWSDEDELLSSREGKRLLAYRKVLQRLQALKGKMDIKELKKIKKTVDEIKTNETE